MDGASISGAVAAGAALVTVALMVRTIRLTREVVKETRLLRQEDEVERMMRRFERAAALVADIKQVLLLETPGGRRERLPALQVRLALERARLPLEPDLPSVRRLAEGDPSELASEDADDALDEIQLPLDATWQRLQRSRGAWPQG